MTRTVATKRLLDALRAGQDEADPTAQSVVGESSDDELIEAWWRHGAADREIAELLTSMGRKPRVSTSYTATNVRKRRHTIGAKRAPRATVDRERLRELHAQGANAAEIAELLGCTHRTAQELLWREGLRTDMGRRSLIREG